GSPNSVLSIENRCDPAPAIGGILNSTAFVLCPFKKAWRSRIERLHRRRKIQIINEQLAGMRNLAKWTTMRFHVGRYYSAYKLSVSESRGNRYSFRSDDETVDGMQR